MGNLYINLGGYFELFLIMVEVGNFDAKLEGYSMYCLQWLRWILFV